MLQLGWSIEDMLNMTISIGPGPIRKEERMVELKSRLKFDLFPFLFLSFGSVLTVIIPCTSRYGDIFFLYMNSIQNFIPFKTEMFSAILPELSFLFWGVDEWNVICSNIVIIIVVVLFLVHLQTAWMSLTHAWHGMFTDSLTRNWTSVSL